MTANTVRDFITDGSDKAVQDIVSKLKFISKIKVGEVVNVQTESLMKIGWVTSAYRTLIFKGEGRDATLLFFRRIIGEAFELSMRYLSSKEKFHQEIGEMIVNALHESKAGIENHKKQLQIKFV